MLKETVCTVQLSRTVTWCRKSCSSSRKADERVDVLSDGALGSPPVAFGLPAGGSSSSAAAQTNAMLCLPPNPPVSVLSPHSEPALGAPLGAQIHRSAFGIPSGENFCWHYLLDKYIHVFMLLWRLCTTVILRKTCVVVLHSQELF